MHRFGTILSKSNEKLLKGLPKMPIRLLRLVDRQQQIT